MKTLFIILGLLIIVLLLFSTIYLFKSNTNYKSYSPKTIAFDGFGNHNVHVFVNEDNLPIQCAMVGGK